MLQENLTGQRVPITITRLQSRDIRAMRQGWTPGFNWRLYFNYAEVEVYKLMRVGAGRIEGAIALEPRVDHVWIHLIEKAPYNRGTLPEYEYIAHHLFAFAANRSFEIQHYIKTYGAVPMGGNRMFIPDVAGKQLIEVYLTLWR